MGLYTFGERTRRAWASASLFCLTLLKLRAIVVVGTIFSIAAIAAIEPLFTGEVPQNLSFRYLVMEFTFSVIVSASASKNGIGLGLASGAVSAAWIWSVIQLRPHITSQFGI
ncbi:hypothetical protein ABOZ73_14025 [Caulobacter sp. 73W]|uniref:Uncharacterized protein n=1 Tax=Caulobacter sp. 73W TaxID=3161137 RepID=A0AB39KR62_9CAUL